MAQITMDERIRNGQGFIAALDQSGGSTPKALRLYGIPEDTYSGDEEMFALIHDMRTRIVRAPAFSGEKVLAAILFERTMDDDFAGKPAARYLWEERSIVPFLKVDKGLAGPADGVRLMKPMPDLDTLLARGRTAGMFGTKMRSVIDAANPAGIGANVAQQFEVGRRILDAGLVPILEPEISISIPDKAQAEEMLRDEVARQLDTLPEGREVMLKLTPPETPGLYTPLIAHPRVLRVAALSGGYSRAEATARLARNPGMIASFSRALTEGLTAQQSDAAFDATLREAIDSIHAASTAA